jgi:hypothetical protein
MVSLGFAGVVMVTIELTSKAEHVLAEFEREVVECRAISYCGFVCGECLSRAPRRQRFARRTARCRHL